MTHCSAMVGNTRDALVQGASLKTPVVNIGTLQQDKTKACHVVNAPIQEEKIAQAIAKALSPGFSSSLETLHSPFERQDTPSRIASLIQEFCGTGMAAKRASIETPLKSRLGQG